jgi:replication factor A1
VSSHNEKIGNPTAVGPAEETRPQMQSNAPLQASSSNAYMHQQPQAPPAQPPPQNVISKSRPSIYPIEGLSPYQNNWTIKARVTQKSDIHTYSNQRGEGKLFNVHLMDESGEIKATGFNAVVDEFYDKLQEGKVYYVSKARVNLAKKKFSNLTNDYELSLERHTEIEEVVHQSNRSITLLTWIHSSSAMIRPMSPPSNSISYHFQVWKIWSRIQYAVRLASMYATAASDLRLDVLGVVKEVGPVTEIVSKTNRTVSLVHHHHFTQILILPRFLNEN